MFWLADNGMNEVMYGYMYQFIDVGECALAHVSIQMVRRGSLLKRKPDNALYNSSLTTTCDVVSVVHVRQQG